MNPIKKHFIKCTLALSSLLLLNACSKFLDIVPDNTITLEDYFANKESAYNALSNVYAGLPNNHLINYTEWLLGDDWQGQRDATKAQSGLAGTRIMEGNQTSNNPLLGYWQGSNYATDLYETIRSANTFLEYIDLVKDIAEQEKKNWIAQVRFLKAYYHFLLVQHYGPIVLAKENVSPNAESSELFVRREKVDVCFDYILSEIDASIPDLADALFDDQLGMVSKAAAKAIKARVLLFRASPFFNGDKDLFGDFYDEDGQPFFPMDEVGSAAWTKKWEEASTAIEEAIRYCEGEGYGLYEYDKQPYKYDLDDWNANTDAMQRLYTLRMLIVDPWNKELIWGRTYPLGQSGTMQDASNIRLPRTFTNGVQETTGNSWNWAAATFQMMSRYYTANGLPIDADRTFDKNNMYRVVTTPEAESEAYTPLRGILQPNYATVNMYLNREPRFYANLGITGGYWRAHQYRIDTEMYGGTAGGYDPSVSGTDFFWTGIGVQKFVHPESKSGSYIRQQHFPYPIIRMADLYLMKAEALNELSGPSQQVYDEIDKVRLRAGIPRVETVWADANICAGTYLNRHLTKEGLRDIILQERSIELAFEGSRYWDMVRYKKAVSEFNTPTTGWVGNAYGQQNFFRLEVKQRRRFLDRNYLWPISLNEMNTNANMIQNPGW